MDSQRSSRGESPASSRRDDWPYEGDAGQTRSEPVHVAMADGTVASVLVERVVNVGTHPELRQRVLRGELHRLNDGRALKLPFVYHDPKARKFALVIPAELSHLELQERAMLMQRLASDTAHSVPAYVGNCTTVVGMEALEAFLDAPPCAGEIRFSVLPPDEREKELKKRSEALAKRELGLAERERQLILTLESMDEREQELADRQRQLEEMQHELLEREDNLEQRLADLERMSGVEDRVYAAAAPDGEWSEVASHRPAPPPLHPTGRLVTRDGGISGGRDSQGQVVEEGEFEELEPVVAMPAADSVSAGKQGGFGRPPPLRLRNGAAPPPLRPRVTEVQSRSISDDGRPAQAAATPGAGSAVPQLPFEGRHAWAEEVPTRAEVLAVPSPDVEPPEHFFSAEQIQMAVVMDEEPWLFVRVDDMHAELMGTQYDLLMQYLEVDGYPTVFLSLVIGQDDEPYVRRLVLDPYAEGDREVLEALAQSFQACVAYYIGDYYQGTIQVSALRESVVHAILRRTEKPAEKARCTGAEALEKAIGRPPPVRAENLPFGPARRRTASLATVAEATEQLAFWMQPKKLDEAQLIYGVPQHVVDASAKRVLGCAVRFGVALSGALIDRALEYGLAENHADLVQHQLSAFASQVQKPANDFGVEATRANWAQLLEQAEACGVSLDDEVRQLAENVQKVAGRKPGAAGKYGPARTRPDEASRTEPEVPHTPAKEADTPEDDDGDPRAGAKGADGSGAADVSSARPNTLEREAEQPDVSDVESKDPGSAEPAR